MLYVNANKHTNIDRFILWKSDQEDMEKVNFFEHSALILVEMVNIKIKDYRISLIYLH